MKYTLLLFLSFFILKTNAQTPLGGIINNYAAVLDINPCTGELTVDDPTGFPLGFRVMVVQIQGATIAEANDLSFGNIINIGNAGFYEINQVGDVNGNVITLSNVLVNNYDVTGKVQLVSMPVYPDAEIVGELQAMPWDGNKGGVIALEIENTLTLNNNINANGVGFRGGQTAVIAGNDCSWLFNQNDYYYEEGAWQGAAKGEGIASFILGKEWGRGPQANGGGGGNDHNAGGGGGGNTVSGGQGGERTPDGIFDCDGEFPGLGSVIFSANSDRAFMGGGGGAGHTNNAGVGSNGGAGGGIIFLKAGTIEGNNFSISALGLTNDTTGEGAGGGGGGGSIVIEAGTINGMPSADVSGGRGGNTGASSAACNGPGGGGSGGRILSNMPGGFNLNLAGGVAGVNANPNNLCNGESNGANAGTTGVVDVIFTLPQSTSVYVPTQIQTQPVNEIAACLETPFTLSVLALGSQLNFQWQLDMGLGAGFENLLPSGAYSGETSASLTVSNPLPNMTGWQFRVLITNNCGEIVISDATVLNVLSPPTVGFTYTNTTGNEYIFTNNSTGGLGVIDWIFQGDFGTDSDTSLPDAPNITYTFPGPGTYIVTQIVANQCGTEVFMETITIGTAPTAVFSAVNTEGCATFVVNFSNASLGSPTMLEWQFPGGLPNALINDPNPTIMYPTPGQYDVILIVTNNQGSDTLTQTAMVNILGLPTPSFNATPQPNNVVDFTNTSVDATSYSWDFGDASPLSNMTNENHQYPIEGIYDVTMTATNICGSSSITQSIPSGAAPVANFTTSQNAGCGTFTTQFFDSSTANPSEWFWQFPGGTPDNSTDQNPIVTYDTPGVYPVSLQVSNLFGTDVNIIESYITVETFPSPSFNYTTDGFTVSFDNTTQDAVNQYIWDFGDGSPTVNDLNPTHTYEQSGTYLVSLNALNSACGGGTSDWVFIVPSSVDEIESLPLVQVYPSPFIDELFINFREVPSQPLELRLVGVDGKVYITQQLDNQKDITLSTSHLASGIYLVQMIYEGEVYSVKVVK